MNSMKKQISILALALFVVTGCTTSQKSVTTPKKQTKTKQTAQKPKSNLPQWLMNPNSGMPNHICANGFSKIMKKERTMNKIAFIKAKANISKQISIYIDEQTTVKTNAKGESTLSSNSRQQSTNMIRNVKITDEYKDKPNELFYVRVCTPKI